MSNLDALLALLVTGSVLALTVASGWRFLLDLVVPYDR